MVNVLILYATGLYGVNERCDTAVVEKVWSLGWRVASPAIRFSEPPDFLEALESATESYQRFSIGRHRSA